jgi:hypothetical protein
MNNQVVQHQSNKQANLNASGAYCNLLFTFVGALMTCTLYICTTTLVLQPNLAGNNVDGIVDSCGCSVERLCNQLTEVCACFFVAEMHHELVLEIYNVLTALQLWQAR